VTFESPSESFRVRSIRRERLPPSYSCHPILLLNSGSQTPSLIFIRSIKSKSIIHPLSERINTRRAEDSGRHDRDSFQKACHRFLSLKILYYINRSSIDPSHIQCSVSSHPSRTRLDSQFLLWRLPGLLLHQVSSFLLHFFL